jgi:signal transduction histidine kinase
MSDSSDEMVALVSDVRHQTNNSLMAILGYVEILLGRGDLPETVVAKLGAIETEAHRIRDQIARTSFIRKRDA